MKVASRLLEDRTSQDRVGTIVTGGRGMRLPLKLTISCGSMAVGV